MRLACSSLLLIAAVGLLTTTGVNAAECTQAQLASFGSIAYDAGVNKACGAMVMGTTPVAGVNLCGNEACVAALQKFTAGVPECEIAGYDVKASYVRAFSMCGGTVGAAPTGMPATMPTARPSANNTESGTANTANTTTTTQPPTSGASSVKEADTPAPSKTSSGSKATQSVTLVATTVFAAGSWLLAA